MGDRFEYRGVRVAGDAGPIVDDFSARIPALGVTVITGPSGAGKTTLLRLLNRLDDPDGGQVLFEGRDVRDYDVLQLRRRAQLVGQVPVTFPGSVADNLRLGVGIPDAPDAPDAPRPGELLERVGLSPDLTGREADRLSVGEAQRMSLARALARRPDCLLLDEPTSALDAASRSGIERLLRSLACDGLTVVAVTHDLRMAREIADHVVEVTAPS